MVDTPSRKLAVIMHADVVGSTGLVRRNETLAHTRIQDAFLRFTKTIKAYGGTAHELRGDALVAEFARASDAVCAAVAFQDENSVFNASLKDDLQPRLRVGIAMGEVVIADNTITGDGVVLAQRLEQIAEPERVCIQGAAYDTVPKRLPFSYESLGEQTLKGFDEPVRAYGASLMAGEDIPSPEFSVASRRWTATDGVHRLNGGKRPKVVIANSPHPSQNRPLLITVHSERLHHNTESIVLRQAPSRMCLLPPF